MKYIALAVLAVLVFGCGFFYGNKSAVHVPEVTCYTDLLDPGVHGVHILADGEVVETVFIRDEAVVKKD